MTFPEATTFANESGWVIYSLNQATCDQDPPWRCCLRAAEGGYRRQISHGKGESPEEAIFDALSAAPELEAEVSVTIEPTFRSVPNLLALIGTKPLQPTRTRT